MKVAQINVTTNLSTGNIASEIGVRVLQAGWESWIFYSRGIPYENGNKYQKIGCQSDLLLHACASRITDSHGLHSKYFTKQFLKQLDSISPDIIHLHNIHGYYLNYPILFDYLKRKGVRVVWTLHDCWPFTGHCAYYTSSECFKWQSHCFKCPEKGSYPSSLVLDRSAKNFELKRESFSGLNNLTLVPVSHWLAEDVKKSFLGSYPITPIHNGVDLNIFTPENNKKEKLILGVASTWAPRKGLPDFIRLRELLSPDYQIILVGLSQKQLKELPKGIIGISRTADRKELASLYSKASVFVNPTYEEALGMVNIEALASGTPVVTYRSGGSPETVDELTGVVVDRGDVNGLVDGIIQAEKLRPEDCRARAVAKFDKDSCYAKYIELYNSIV